METSRLVATVRPYEITTIFKSRTRTACMVESGDADDDGIMAISMVMNNDVDNKFHRE